MNRGIENEFFKEVTLRICSSLDIDKALWRCLLYIKEIIPAQELLMTVYDESTGVLEIVASADEEKGYLKSEKISIPLGLRGQLEDVSNYPRVRVANNIFADPIVERIAKHSGWKDSSVIVGRLIIEGKFVGSFIVRADKNNQYNKEHLRLWSLVNEPAAMALANSRKYGELLRLKELIADDSRYFQYELRKELTEEIIGMESGLRGVMEHVRKVAQLSSPVLLLGETGTGKEVIANAIHNLSSRSNGPMIKVNCGAIPDSLIDSELFGHEKGAFTGAISQKRGRFERADGGTIFLDEVSELPPHAQVRLLRVLQEKEIERVGGTQTIKLDIRVISATHKDLFTLVKEGQFREDLYYRLGVYPIRIPPLRERKMDIPDLVHYFLRKRCKDMGLRKVPEVGDDTIKRLMEYDWPGNVREVGNVVERALIQSAGARYLNFDGLITMEEKKLPINDTKNIEYTDILSLDEVQAKHIRRVLEITGGRVEGKDGAARILNINPGTLRHRMRKLGIPYGRKKGG
ncbi:MAG: sigma 54-interacting transcriptional regulator [Syntrophorhabdaceae bacterium]|nr:sigma 54-interacting transcriptional regulator [Syntrophorhabdaceae bacterium]